MTIHISHRISVTKSLALAASLSALCAGSALARSLPLGYVPYSGGTYTQDFDTTAYQAGTPVNSANPVTLTNSELSTPASVTYTLPNTTASPSATPTTFSFSDSTLGSGSNSLATPNTTSTPNPNDPGMDGWWGTTIVAPGSNTTVANRYAAQDGSQTTGGLISFGTENAVSGASNRALGLLSTATTGATSMGLALQNTGTTTFTSLTLSYTGELWRQQTSQKFLHFGYLVTTNVTSNTSGGGALPTSGTTGDTNLDVVFPTGASTGTTNNNTGPLMTSAQNDTITGINWAPNTTLWLTWQTWDSTADGTSANPGPSANGGSQGLAIDNLSFTAGTVPEPSTYALAGGGLIVMLGMLRRSRRTA